MDIQNFLSPAEETVQDSLEQIEEQILAQFQPEVEQETDEDIEQLPKITAEEALEALTRLRLHEEQAEEGNQSLITQLSRHERVLQARKFQSKKQQDIRSYFRS